MIINRSFLEDFLGVKIQGDFEVKNLVLANSSLANSLSFMDDERFLNQLNENTNIICVITNAFFADKINPEKNVIVVNDPRFSFYSLINHLGKIRYDKFPSVISNTAIIHTTAFVSEYNVLIGPGTVIEPNVTILSDVEIGENCVIRAGSVIGAEGFEQKRTSKGILPVYHDGKVIIGNNVHIGALNAISKGFSFRNTVIGDDSKTDNLVHIAHCVQIGKRCLFPASCMVAGSVTIEDDVWIGPNASISSGITIGKSAFITIGSVVTKNVENGEKVTGNFAIPHQKFMQNFKNTLS